MDDDDQLTVSLHFATISRRDNDDRLIAMHNDNVATMHERVLGGLDVFATHVCYVVDRSVAGRSVR